MSSAELITEDEVQERLEFLRARQEGIGGSDIACILGLSSYRNALDIYHDKTRPIREEDVRGEGLSIHLLRGRELEEKNIELYQRLTGREGRRIGQRRHPELEFATCNADWQVFGREGEEEPFDATGVLEAKCPSVHRFDGLAESGLRDSELLQLQWNAGVLGYPWGSFSFLSFESSSGPLLTFDLEADRELIAELQARAERFWRHHVLERIPPDPSEWESEEYGVELPASGGERVELAPDGRAAELLEKMLSANELKKEAKEEYNRLRDKLDELLQVAHPDAGKFRVPGIGKLSRVVSEGRTKLDAETLKAARPLDRDAFVRYLTGQAEAAPPRVVATETAEQLADDLELEVERFEKKGKPYSYLRAYPAKD